MTITEQKSLLNQALLHLEIAQLCCKMNSEEAESKKQEALKGYTDCISQLAAPAIAKAYNNHDQNAFV